MRRPGQATVTHAQPRPRRPRLHHAGQHQQSADCQPRRDQLPVRRRACMAGQHAACMRHACSCCPVREHSPACPALAAAVVCCRQTRHAHLHSASPFAHSSSPSAHACPPPRPHDERRAQRAAKKLGIGCVAVFTEPDALSLHVLQAPESVCLGASPKEYLNAEKLIQVAKETGERQRPKSCRLRAAAPHLDCCLARPACWPSTLCAEHPLRRATHALTPRAGCDAVFPGYGFLSENTDFSALCAANGIAFIGPTAGALRCSLPTACFPGLGCQRWSGNHPLTRCVPPSPLPQTR